MTAIGSNALLQALSLILIARNLGPAEYAAIVAATACAVIAAEFVGLGSGDLLIRDVSRSKDAHAKAFGSALKLLGLTIIPFCLAGAWVADRWFDTEQSLLVILALVASEIVAIRFAWLGEQIAIAHHAIHTATVTRIFASTVRFGAVALAVWLGTTSAQQWAVYAVISSGVLAIGCMTISIRKFGRPTFDGGAAVGSRDGVLFSMMQIVRAAQFSVDKFAVSAVASPTALGAFGAGSRVAHLGVMPSSAVTRMTYPTFFAEGSDGIRGAIALARRLAAPVIGLGLFSSVAVAGIAFFIPYLLGLEFENSVTYVILLSPVPLAYAASSLGGNILSGANLQTHRTIAMTAGLVATAIASFLGAQCAGTEGAILGYTAGHYIFAVVVWVTVWRIHQLQKS